MTDRHDADYAIEFGEYLAKASEEYITAVGDAFGGVSIPSVGDHDAYCDTHRGLASAIYEFRKRARRVQRRVGTRINELLAANNREVERRRAAEGENCNLRLRLENRGDIIMDMCTEYRQQREEIEHLKQRRDALVKEVNDLRERVSHFGLKPDVSEISRRAA